MRYAIVVAAVGFGSALPLVALGDPVVRTPQQVVEHHFSAAASGDINALVSDYADNATVISAGGVIHGKAAIRQQFARMMHPRAGAAAARPAGVRRDPQIKREFFTHDAAWLLWVQNDGKPGEVRGVETYIIRNGKIDLETVGTVTVHAAADTAQ